MSAQKQTEQKLPVTVTADELDKNLIRSEVDQAAFEAIFHEHWPKVYGVLYRLVGDSAEAEDLALETFWRLYRRAPRLIAVNSSSGWLYRVATNLGLNALRSGKRRDFYEEQAGRFALENNAAPDPSLAVERAQERERVRTVLGKMKERHARLLVLRHSGLSYAEVAAALKIAPASVGKLLSRAEREFEERYGKLEGKEDAPE